MQLLLLLLTQKIRMCQLSLNTLLPVQNITLRVRTEVSIAIVLKIFGFSICRRSQVLRLKASSSSLGLAEEHMSYNLKHVGEIDGGQDLFVEMKQRFLNFKKQKYM